MKKENQTSLHCHRSCLAFQVRGNIEKIPELRYDLDFARDTIELQIDALETYAKENGHTVVESYVCRDRYTGTELARPELDRLRDGAQAGAFEAVLVYDPDRLSRKYVYQILILEEFERLGIPILFLEQPPPDDPKSVLLVQIQGAVAEYERAKITERHRRGKLYRARQGEVFWNSVPYGYRRIARQTVFCGEGYLRHLLDIPAVDPSLEPVTTLNGTSFS